MSTAITYKGYTFVVGFASILIRRGTVAIGHRATIAEARALVDALLVARAIRF